MVLKINGKEYEIRFGFAGIDYLDRVYYVESHGVKLGQGLGMLYTYLEMQHPMSLLHAIKAGTITEKQAPSVKEIEEFVEEIAETEGLEKLFKDLGNELKKQPLTKGTIKTHLKNTAQAIKEMD